MRKLTYISLVALLTVIVGGCLTTGQIKVKDDFGDGVSHDSNIYSYDLDLNTNTDYTDNKDKVKSVDGVAVVGVIKNHLETEIQAEIYISDDPNLESAEEIMDPKQATRVFVSPTVAGNDSLLVNYADGLAAMENTQAIIDQLFGPTADGMFTIYAIGSAATFNFTYKAEVVLTLTVEL
jgi:hypothetical protein